MTATAGGSPLGTMRSFLRTLDRPLIRDAAAISAAMIAVGASFGAIAIGTGLPTWVPFLMSTVVFAGGAQFMAVGLLAAGNPIAAVLAGLLLNARHLPFGLAVSETVGHRWWHRILGSHLMTDEVVAFTLAESDPARRRRTYWVIGVVLFTSWNLGTLLGVLVGSAAGDPETFGLDAAFPAGLIALILPSLRDRDTRRVALVGRRDRRARHTCAAGRAAGAVRAARPVRAVHPPARRPRPGRRVRDVRARDVRGPRV